MLRLSMLAAPRQWGCVELTALDVAARGLFVTQYIEYNGLISVEALQVGLQWALARYPVLSGWLQKQGDGGMQLCWDSHDSSKPGFDFTASVCKGKALPSIWSTWDLWRHGALPKVHNRLAAAEVTHYPDINRSILVFSFDHAVFDQLTAHQFLHSWLQQAAAAATAAATSKPAKVLASVGERKAVITVTAEAASIQQGDDAAPGLASVRTSPVAAAAGTRAAAGCMEVAQSSMFDRSCFFSGWNLPDSKHGCREWLRKHQGQNCPFPWNPLDPADSCLMGWKGLLQGSDSEFSTWRIPGQLLRQWIFTAEAACPLSTGVWYSSGTAAAAVILLTMYAAAPEKAKQFGGLHLSTVVNLRGGRCGMNIPRDSATNASVSAIRVWCPEPLLAAAAAALTTSAENSNCSSSNGPVVSPELMHHLRMGLQEQLNDPQGIINRQFEWFEAARRSGLTSRVQLCQGLLQTDAGDIVIDMITHSAAELPTLPGTAFAAGSVRMLSSYMDRIIMVTPVPRAGGQPGNDLQIEVSFPRSKATKLYKIWEQLGFEQLFSSPATKEGLMYPNSMYLCVWMVVGCLPWLLLRWLTQLWLVFRKTCSTRFC